MCKRKIKVVSLKTTEINDRSFSKTDHGKSKRTQIPISRMKRRVILRILKTLQQ